MGLVSQTQRIPGDRMAFETVWAIASGSEKFHLSLRFAATPGYLYLLCAALQPQKRRQPRFALRARSSVRSAARARPPFHDLLSDSYWERLLRLRHPGSRGRGLHVQ